jgi:hypothetical protein
MINVRFEMYSTTASLANKLVSHRDGQSLVKG